MNVRLEQAATFAAFKHRNQKRKYTGEDYFVHCREVASIVESVTDNVDMICAAYLHDVLEDTPTDIRELFTEFGPVITNLVCEVTDKYGLGSGNRYERKLLEAFRLATVSPEAQTIKLADLISNTQSIVERDPVFAKVYLLEKERLLKVLVKGDQRLLGRAQKILEDSKKTLGILGGFFDEDYTKCEEVVMSVILHNPSLDTMMGLIHSQIMAALIRERERGTHQVTRNTKKRRIRIHVPYNKTQENERRRGSSNGRAGAL